jgi:ElaB/YqjD/DUF883 family membrane-anchored ribosome-binding protein
MVYSAKMQILNATFLTVTLVVLVSCQSIVDKAARNTAYSAYELIGVQKRDLLKKRVDNARDEQKEAGKDFEDALTKLKRIYGFSGGNLEKEYNTLKSSYDKANEQAKDVHESIKKVETVAEDLFNEWEKEIGQIETASLRTKSRESLLQTRHRYGQLHSSLKASEDRMEPVLRKFNDQVLYLKHNLNAQAIASLKGETLTIEADIQKLIAEMNKSISAADQFIQQMPE